MYGLDYVINYVSNIIPFNYRSDREWQQKTKPLIVITSSGGAQEAVFVLFHKGTGKLVPGCDYVIDYVIYEKPFNLPLKNV